MSWYRAYFLNDRRSIVDVEEFRSASDALALEAAWALLRRRGNFPAFELWQEARPISLYPQGQAIAA